MSMSKHFKFKFDIIDHCTMFVWPPPPPPSQNVPVSLSTFQCLGPVHVCLFYCYTFYNNELINKIFSKTLVCGLIYAILTWLWLWKFKFSYMYVLMWLCHCTGILNVWTVKLDGDSLVYNWLWTRENKNMQISKLLNLITNLPPWIVLLKCVHFIIHL